MRQIELQLVGETLWATADRVLAWPREDTIFLADLHLGKDATFRQAGSWVPPGTTASDLARLTKAVAEWRARRVVILGDIFHSEHASEPSTMREVRDWLDRHADVELIMIAGNHDRHSSHGFDLKPQGLTLGPWRLYHHPAEEKKGYVLCGHIHPKILLKSSSRETLSLPCFVAGGRQCILPAFSEFTGGAIVRPSKEDRIIAIAGDEVVNLPNGRSKTAAD